MEDAARPQSAAGSDDGSPGAAPAPPGPPPRRILIVDDSHAVRVALRETLLQMPAVGEVVEAADGAQGIKQFRESEPDIVFTDLTMPVLNGFAVIEMVQGINPRVPVIVLSADIQKRTYEKVMELGAFRMLRKPPQKEEVRRAFADALAPGAAGAASP
jgi:two-component system chemotaxis response regulator CheY